MEFHFRQNFRLRPKMKNAFRSASSIHHKKVLVLVLKKSLDYITAYCESGYQNNVMKKFKQLSL